ncbi:hypothetical protein EVAR_28472_1 [Eumeta japonica]|uniref:Uncharacterized protein n=1 Tax=Eumeta variegata TaxID=151549 RepID=A0A4C1V9N8_EUMVA|nr:hypothetical protein EVAR_28472_1 [Eumeta japonica]
MCDDDNRKVVDKNVPVASTNGHHYAEITRCIAIVPNGLLKERTNCERKAFRIKLTLGPCDVYHRHRATGPSAGKTNSMQKAAIFILADQVERVSESHNLEILAGESLRFESHIVEVARNFF